MDWRLVFQLSLFGLTMGIATVFVIPSNMEPWLWLVIFCVCAFLIARVRSSLQFLHGLLVGVVNSVWVTSAHIIFLDRYIASHAKEAAMMKSMSLPASPRLMMALVGTIIGVVSGLVLGLFAFMAGKFVKPRLALRKVSEGL